jgi:uncharacterized membrane protein
MRIPVVWVVIMLLLLAVPVAAAPREDGEIAEMARVCTQMMGMGMAMMGRMMGSGMMGRGGMMGGMMPMGSWALQALLFWVLLLGSVVVVILLLRRTKGGASEAMAALQLRLAKGEMSADEYEQVRRLLQ